MPLEFSRRFSKSGDEGKLKELWLTVFKDSEDYVNSFFQFVYHPGMAVVTEAAGKIVSAMYLVDGIAVISDAGAQKCRYLYSIATYPEYRGNFCTSRMLEFALDELSEGTPIFTFPASQGLSDWYKSAFGAKEAFNFFESNIASAQLAPHEGGFAEGIGPEEYFSIRSRLLAGGCYAEFSNEILRWQEHLSKSSGGNLLRIETERGFGTAALERDGDEVFVRELLCSPEPASFCLSAIAAYFPSKRFRVRTAFPFGQNAALRSVLLVGGGLDTECKNGSAPYWGLVFD